MTFSSSDLSKNNDVITLEGWKTSGPFFLHWGQSKRKIPSTKVVWRLLGNQNRAQNGLEGYYIRVILPKNELMCTLLDLLAVNRMQYILDSDLNNTAFLSCFSVLKDTVSDIASSIANSGVAQTIKKGVKEAVLTLGTCLGCK